MTGVFDALGSDGSESVSTAHNSADALTVLAETERDKLCNDRASVIVSHDMSRLDGHKVSSSNAFARRPQVDRMKLHNLFNEGLGHGRAGRAVGLSRKCSGFDSLLARQIAQAGLQHASLPHYVHESGSLRHEEKENRSTFAFAKSKQRCDIFI